MRWFVEVSRVGDSTPAERYCLEAKAWQAALQETRKLRGDTGPLSKFSIELLDDGYRAVDPVQKIRYLVNQAPSETPIVMPPPINGSAHALGSSPSAVPAAPVVVSAPAAVIAAAPAAPVVAAVAPAVSAVASPPLASVPPAASPAPVASVPPAVASASPPVASIAPKPSVKSTAPAAPRPSPRRSHKNAAKTQSLPSSSPEAAPSLAPALETASSSAPVAAAAALSVPQTMAVAPAPAVVVAAAPMVAVVAEQNVAAMPAPRPAPAPEAAAAEVSAAPVASAAPPEAMRAELASYELFVSRTQEPTPEAPITYREIALAVAPGLAREAVEALLVDRLQALKTELSHRPPGKLVQIAIFDHTFEQRPTRAPLGTLAWKDWRGEPVVGFPAFGEAMPPMSTSMPPAAEPAEVPAAAPAPAATAPAAGAAQSAVPVAKDEAEPVPLRKPLSSDPGRSSRPKLGQRRRAGEDLISELFDVMHELTFARDIAVGSDFVLNVLNDVLPCEVVFIHVFDINTRNFVVVRGRGAGAERALLTRTSDSDPLIAEVMRRDRARVFKAQGDARFSAGRWQSVTAQKREVLAGAVRQGGRYLGMIELCNPLGETPFHDSEVNALDYICEQYADFVASRPIVLDPDVILGR